MRMLKSLRTSLRLPFAMPPQGGSSGATETIILVARPKDPLLSPLPRNGATFVSAYSGCGGLDLGFAAAGFEPLWANDLDRFAVATHNALLGEKAVAGSIDDVTWPKRGSADLVIGGPPCQGFSVAGKMRPDDPRSNHVFRFLDLVEHVRPDAFVMENVKALAVNERWAGVRSGLLSRSRSLGFTPSLLVVNAADFGVPQRRERMFLIGMRHPEPLSDIQATSRRHTTVRAALSRLPAWRTPGNDTICTAVVTPAKRPIMRPTPWRGSLLFNGNGRPLKLDQPAPTLPASMGGNATPIIDQREFETGEESWVVSYHARLQQGRKPVTRIPRHLRRVTAEEAAELQSFPLGMTWAGPTSAKYRQIGNAVPPRLAFQVASAVAEALGMGRAHAARFAA
jgi:DNA (cytosine-5)-methyltransferase 1